MFYSQDSTSNVQSSSGAGAGAGNDSVAVIIITILFNCSAIYTKIELIVICNSFPYCTDCSNTKHRHFVCPFEPLKTCCLSRVCVNEATEANTNRKRLIKRKRK